MPWTARFIQDTAVPGLGTMRAEFADDTGAILCTFEQQMKNGDDSQAGPFIDKAKSVLADAQKKINDDKAQQQLAELLAAKLNG